MNIQERIDLLVRLGNFLTSNDADLQHTISYAYDKNNWFTKEFVTLAIQNIATNYLSRTVLDDYVSVYALDNTFPVKNIGIVMAGNIPLVGFHDFLCTFLIGYQQKIKLSSKDDVLLPFLIDKMESWNAGVKLKVAFADRVSGCDAYIATGSQHSQVVFEEYFGKYPHIIRHNRTGISILTGSETADDLKKLSDDIHQYFGRGCRNVTKLYVPAGYKFDNLLAAFSNYNYFKEHAKYMNNYDYQLSILSTNKTPFYTNGVTLITQNSSLFTPVSLLYFEEYDNIDNLKKSLSENHKKEVQEIVGSYGIPFGSSQHPKIMDYADGVDTMKFLIKLDEVKRDDYRR